MSVTTRSLGCNYLIKYWSVNPTCTACSADADAIRFTVGTCSTIGGFNSLDLGAERAVEDVSAFEDTMEKSVVTRRRYPPINISGILDPGDTAQKTLHGDIIHEGVVADTTTVRVFGIVDTVQKRKYTFKGYVASGKIGAAVKGATSFAMTLVPISKVMACTTP